MEPQNDSTSKANRQLTIPEALNQAVAHHRAGQLQDAERLYRAILQAQPKHPDANHNLGVLAVSVNQIAAALALFETARAGNPAVTQYWLSSADALVRCARPDEAQSLVAQAQSSGLDEGGVQRLREYLAVHQRGDSSINAPGERYQQALQAHQSGDLQTAEAGYRQLIAQNPAHAEALHRLGLVLYQRGDPAGAEAFIRRAIRINDQVPAYHCHHGVMLKALLRLKEALQAYDRALALKLDYAEAHSNRGNALRNLGRLEEALQAYDQALALKPDYAEAHSNRGNALYDLGRLEEALQAYDQALALKPDFAEAHSNRGTALYDLGRLEEALQAYDQALALKPDYAEAHFNRGNALKDLGRLEEALGAYEQALRLKPEYAEATSNRLFLLHYHEGDRAFELLAQERRIAQMQRSRPVEPQMSFSRPNTGRRLRVGYVSGYFYHHAVGFFVQDLFTQHDRTRIELSAYSGTHRVDAVTNRIRDAVDHWQTFVGLTDEAAAARIRADEIDVLIDLSGHNSHNRLGVFAQRAAPVQAHYLGFPGSTYLPEMDYWIGDDLLTPAWVAEHYLEQLWPLPRVWVAYHGTEQAPKPAWCPRDDGVLWLGSFNNLIKITPTTIASWARVLHALPEAKLLLKTNELADASNRERVLRAFSGQGIAGERIELQDRQATPSWSAHMAYYDRLDIALDPIGPVCGGTTTCDALWMGVPVVTKLGDRMGSRMSASMLTALGREEWIATDDEGSIAKVVALARDVEGRRQIRLTQREQMRQSPLCDARGLATALEDAYEAMYERWWAEQSSKVAAS
ncbi:MULTISPECIES: tetratricopeptide repeat protein [Thiorhodovibrio]|uniref:tetratricopeptide repeat protein n=1 Tax=Thiorhodovibrio TaxID=61593 RepID=UPI00191417BD|nr:MULTISPECIES: tetratricopeptide repeat protein [Thiorhodovibrio]MBK5969458.1 hypothetical protein [Thiorhodovibrio winogradskyi]WPL15034.1 TPR repeat-containing protein YrrB [Thiorhodovibrio litoralis]